MENVNYDCGIRNLVCRAEYMLVVRFKSEARRGIVSGVAIINNGKQRRADNA